MILWVSLMRPKWKDREVKELVISKTALSGFEDVMQGNIQTGNICQYSRSVILAAIGIPFAVGLNLMDFSGFFVLPVPPQRQRPVKLDSPGNGAIIGAATTVPAFFRVQDNRGFALLRMRYIYIYLACFHAGVAPDTDILVE
jgi:hypothetical protein